MTVDNMAWTVEATSVLIGWLVVSCVGSASHFVYQWVGCVSYIAMYVPVNESVWEHLKLVVWPLFGWWGISLIWREFDDCLNGLAVSEIVSVCTMLVLYYTYMGIFDYECLPVDIFIFLVSVFAGLLLSELYLWSSRLCLFSSILLFFFCFICLSIFKPALPLFFDEAHETYEVVC